MGNKRINLSEKLIIHRTLSTKKNYMNYKVMLAKILSEKELADMDIKNIKEDDTLLE